MDKLRPIDFVLKRIFVPKDPQKGSLAHQKTPNIFRGSFERAFCESFLTATPLASIIYFRAKGKLHNSVACQISSMIFSMIFDNIPVV